jgi:hypothetical protein
MEKYQLMNQSTVHCVETEPEDSDTLKGSFNWYSFRDKEDRIIRRKLKVLKPTLYSVGRLECRATVQGEGKSYSVCKTAESELGWDELEKLYAFLGMQSESFWGCKAKEHSSSDLCRL